MNKVSIVDRFNCERAGYARRTSAHSSKFLPARVDQHDAYVAEAGGGNACPLKTNLAQAIAITRMPGMLRKCWQYVFQNSIEGLQHIKREQVQYLFNCQDNRTKTGYELGAVWAREILIHIDNRKDLAELLVSEIMARSERRKTIAAEMLANNPSPVALPALRWLLTRKKNLAAITYAAKALAKWHDRASLPQLKSLLRSGFAWVGNPGTSHHADAVRLMEPVNTTEHSRDVEATRHAIEEAIEKIEGARY